MEKERLLDKKNAFIHDILSRNLCGWKRDLHVFIPCFFFSRIECLFTVLIPILRPTSSGTALAVGLVLVTPKTVFAVITAGCIGMLLNPLLSGFQSGLGEGLAVLILFLYLNYLYTGSKWGGIAILVCGYSFAWVGHFFYEHNKPASWIYVSLASLFICSLALSFFSFFNQTHLSEVGLISRQRGNSKSEQIYTFF